MVVAAALLVGLVGCPSNDRAETLQTVADPRGPDLDEQHELAIESGERALAEAKADVMGQRNELRTAERKTSTAEASLDAAERAKEVASDRLDDLADDPSVTPAEIAEAKQALRLAEAHIEQSSLELDFRKAQVDARRARVEAAEATVLSARAEFELTKLRAQMYGQTDGRSTEATERIAAFQQQAADANEALATAQRAVLDEEEDVADARRALASK